MKVEEREGEGKETGPLSSISLLLFVEKQGDTKYKFMLGILSVRW